MRAAVTVHLLLISLGLSLPALAAKLVDAPPPPLIPEAELEKDGTPKKPALLETPTRGQLLYENHCMGCHESVVYIRTRRLIKSLPELRAETGRWATYTNLPWGKEELEDVVEFLNSRFYKY